jgi:hypothetical protein
MMRIRPDPDLQLSLLKSDNSFLDKGDDNYPPEFVFPVVLFLHVYGCYLTDGTYLPHHRPSSEHNSK